MEFFFVFSKFLHILCSFCKEQCAKTYCLYIWAREIILKLCVDRVFLFFFVLCKKLFFAISTTTRSNKVATASHKRKESEWFKKWLFRIMIVANTLKTKESRLRSLHPNLSSKEEKKSMWNIHKGRNSTLYKSAHM